MIEATTSPDALNPPEGQLLLVDKPFEWTSFDAVNKLRYNIKRVYKLKKIKVGHAGTLDPLASGLLLICTGPYTKRLQELTGLDKTYTGSFELGKTTPSFDLESEVDAEYPTEQLTEDIIHAAAQQMIGEQDQMPPVFSAKKVDGKRAYLSARKGKDVVLTPHRITIHEFEITGIEGSRVDFLIRCSKGTYIRSIARDFGLALQSGAYLSALRRTAVGEYRIEDAFEIEALIAHLRAHQTDL